MEALSSSETSILTEAKRPNIKEDAILHSHHRENFKSYIEIFLLSCYTCILRTLWLGASSPFDQLKPCLFLRVVWPARASDSVKIWRLSIRSVADEHKGRQRWFWTCRYGSRGRQKVARNVLSALGAVHWRGGGV
jgi:hypothetical protein